ncbi:nucleoside deaminase [Ralstonia pickettii]|nr:nucleoside deaminase [Ralstonia pickettii]
MVAQTHDPTAQAEILAIREACKKLQTEHLTDCDIYILASPCPIFLGSMVQQPDKECIKVYQRWNELNSK